MTKVFAVWTGEWSDKGVEGVFSTRENAEAFIAHFGKVLYDARIEEYELDARKSKVDQGLLVWQVVWRLNRNSDPVAKLFPSADTFGEHIGVSRYDNTASICVWAKDEQSALKIATERYVKWIAEQDQAAIEGKP